MMIWAGGIDADGRVLDATGGAVYELTFGTGETPVVEPSGYWSVTMYNENSLLVDNPIDRYATRPDRPGLHTGADGRLTLMPRRLGRGHRGVLVFTSILC